MSDLLENLSNQTPSEMQRRSVESMRWFTGQLRKIRTSPQNFYKYTDLKKTRRYLDGRMYMFFYEAKWQDKLPYWDAFPCVIILDTYQDGFLGLNLHYIPPLIRAKLLNECFDFIKAEDKQSERFELPYEIVNASPKFKFAKACIKRYLYSQMKSSALEVEPIYWDLASMLPVAQFQKQNVRKVYEESRKINV